MWVIKAHPICFANPRASGGHFQRAVHGRPSTVNRLPLACLALAAVGSVFIVTFQRKFARKDWSKRETVDGGHQR
jgi:hypothetical protein